MHWRFALMLMAASRVLACGCGGTSPSVKQTWERTPFVFLGTVELADPDENGNRAMFHKQFVRIRVDEAFKGVSKGQTIELHQGASDCDAKFRTGERNVFYLRKDMKSGDWTVPSCMRSLESAEPLGDDLLFLHGLPQSAIGTRLSGAVEFYEDSPTEAFRRIGGAKDVRVKIAGPMGLTQEAVTNSAGVYEVFGLRPGRYSVKIEVPNGWKVDFPFVTGSEPVSGDRTAVELVSNGSAGVSFMLKADTRISGRLLDAQGAPMTGVCIDLEAVEGRGEDGGRFFDCSKTDGVFGMEMMPPGRYWLVARDQVSEGPLSSQSRLYYPGVRDRERAAMVSVEAGKYVEHLDIRRPADDKRHKITGRFRFADGAPVSGATVTFTSPQHGYTDTASTDRDGSFGLLVVAGMKGQLNGALGVLELILRSCPGYKVGPRERGAFRFMDAEPISVLSDSDHEHVELKLSSSSCKSLPAGRK